MSCSLAVTAATGAGGGAILAIKPPIILVLNAWNETKPKPTTTISTITMPRRMVQRHQVRGLRGRPAARGNASVIPLLLMPLLSPKCRAESHGARHPVETH